VLEDHSDDPVEELTSLINSLLEDEQIDLVTLIWLGRDDYSISDWATVRRRQPALTTNAPPVIFSAHRC
jgi:uncharacterized protein DUF3775